MSLLVATACFVAFFFGDVNAQKIPWLSFNGGGSRSGINTKETQLTQSTVKNLKSKWSVTLPETADTAPVFLPDVQTAQGVQDLVFILDTWGANGLYALNAATGSITWSVNNSVGSGVVMSTPAIDPSLQYIYAYRNDGKVHKFDVTNGKEITGNGFPAVITLIPSVEKGSSSINIFNGYLYMTISGYIGDGGHYVGHVVAINLSNGASTVFNVLCSDKQVLLVDNAGASNYCSEKEAGVWAVAGAVQDPDDGSVYIVSGNGLFNADQTGGKHFGDSVMRLKAGLPTNPLIDSYTPINASKLQGQDLDLGSTAPCMLPVQPKSKTPYMALQGGKDQTLRLLNRRDMSGQNKIGAVAGELQIFRLNQGGNVYSHPLAWVDPATNLTWIFFATDYGLSAYNLNTDANGISTISEVYVLRNLPGSSPFMANNVLYLQGPNVISALVPQTGAILWQGTGGSLHWQSPIVVNGMIFFTDNSRKAYAFGL